MIAICTAFNEALLAVENGKKCALKELDSNTKHSESVMPALAALIDEVSLNLGAEERYAVVIGPGSFTGLRLGLALVKGLIAGSGKGKVAPLTSFDLLARAYINKFNPQTDFAVVIDALSGLCFVQTFDKAGKPKGEGKMIEQKALDSLSLIKVCHSQDKFDFVKVAPTARDLYDLAKSADFDRESAPLEPLYLRLSQAEAALEQKNLKKSEN